ncbi:hypothetical protein BDZ89DRAFT_1140427 [Hymenopellis radicata]|nr:hypothetical protein BDZ89DRAFT_1140427 [Hymenopellis radicata]
MLAFLTFVVFLISVLVWAPGFVRLGAIRTGIYWMARSWLWNYPLTSACPDLWYTGDPNDRKLFLREKIRLIRIWGFLRPFFASRGYDLFLNQEPSDVFGRLSPVSPRGSQNPGHPFAQNYYRNDDDATFSFFAPRVWPARDSQGRDIIIKALSGRNPPRELCALRKLNSPSLRQHPLNHTIPLIDLLVFNKEIFAIMPRWGSACCGAFSTVGEIVRYGQAFFEVVYFLHSHRMAHGDISGQNLVMDVAAPEGPDPYYYGGLRGVNRKYALIDFETMLIASDDEDIHSAYRQDLHDLATTLQPTLRCAEDMLPGLVSLLEDMKTLNSPLTASVALARYEAICKDLPDTILNSPVQAVSFMNALTTILLLRDMAAPAPIFQLHDSVKLTKTYEGYNRHYQPGETGMVKARYTSGVGNAFNFTYAIKFEATEKFNAIEEQSVPETSLEVA